MSYRDDANQAEIYIMDRDGANQVNISQSAANDRDPVWSIAGTHITFISNRAGNDDVYTMKADGSDVYQLTTHTASDSRPVWLPK